MAGDLRAVVDRIRRQERIIRDICVTDANMPRQEFLSRFPGNESSEAWLEELLNSGESWANKLKAHGIELTE